VKILILSVKPSHTAVPLNKSKKALYPEGGEEGCGNSDMVGLRAVRSANCPDYGIYIENKPNNITVLYDQPVMGKGFGRPEDWGIRLRKQLRESKECTMIGAKGSCNHAVKRV
jgi:hypothetical protein